MKRIVRRDELLTQADVSGDAAASSPTQWPSTISARSVSSLTPEHLMDYAQAATAPLPVFTA
jgi:hypothetical protein